MKFDQDLRLNLRYDFGKMNSTLGSVVPLAMFVHLSTPASIGWVAQSFLVRSYRQGDISFFFFDSFSSAFSFSPPQPAPPSPPHFPFLLSYFSYYSVWDEDSCSLVSFYLSFLILLNVKLKTINGLEYIYKSKSESFHHSKHIGRYANNQNGNLRCFFPWRGGGVSSSTYLFWKIIFLKTILNHSLTVKTCFALSLGFILCIYSSWGDFEHG